VTNVRRTTYIILALVFLLAAFPVLGSTLQDIYQNITKSSDRITPDSYRVRVENESFNEALAELPEEIRTGKAEPAVMIYFEKGDGVKIVIENIRSEYASLFSMYEDYLKFSGISNVQNPKEFKEIIDQGKVKLHEEDGNTVILKAWDPEQEGRGDNYAFFTLNKSKWVIVKALYYLDGTPYVQAENKYKDIGKYYLPYEIVLMNLVDNSSEVFRFMEYQFK
jgi:hypothetical protein